MTDEEIRQLLALAAVDALDPGEQADLDAVLAERPDLAAELDDLRAATLTMATAVAETPPPSLRSDVLAAIAADPGDGRAEVPPPPPPFPPPLPSPSPSPSTVTAIGSRRRRRILLAVAAALVAVVVSATLATRVLDDPRADEVAAVLDDDEAVRVELSGDIGDLTVVYSAHERGAVMVGDDIAGLDDDQVYELWTQPPDGDTMVSVGTFRPDDDGLVESLMEDVELVPTALFAVTIEPPGGSAVPTLPTVAQSA